MGRFVHFHVLTLLATTAVAAETGSPTVLPDAPSAVLAQRFHGPTENTSKTQPLPPDTASSDGPAAQEDARPSILRRAMRDQKEIYSAPFHRRNVKWDFLFLAATGGLIAGDRHISGALSRNHADVSLHISDVGMYSMTVSVAGLWLSSLKTQDAHARETGILAAEAFGNTAAVVGLTQLIAGRERPTEGSGNGRFWQNNALGSSFPSGHSSFTWTMASVVAHEYPKPWVRWLVYGTATTVSVTRVTGLKHFPSDVAVGGAFGFLIGQQIFNAHCVPGLSSHCRSSRKSVKSKERRTISAQTNPATN
jgi:membrane-associated phospholipid phosphatase